jgi:hypothetical protein
MELAVCFLGDSKFYGIDNRHMIYQTILYSYISTTRKLKRVEKYIEESINPNLKNNQRADIEIVKKIHIRDKDGYIYHCAIYYTYLLRIIQKRWRKKIELRRKIYNHPLFINYLKRREMTNKVTAMVRDNGIIGLFYGNLVVNI